VAGVLDGNPRAVLFTAAGPEKAELVGNVMGSRRRIAMALDSDERGVLGVLQERLKTPQAPVRVKNAPVQEVVRKGDDADLCALPVHLQHGEDGAPYISASLDFALFPGSGFTNVGCRRIMLRGPRQAGIDLIAPSDLRAIYLEAAAKNEKLPVSYVVGSHPADFIAAVTATPPMDELQVIGALRGAPVPIVKCVTNDVWVPADAEYVLEGFLDPRGHTEPEGPYGEYVGYYGVVKRNPIFRVTAITHRRDALFQTATIGGKYLARTDTAQLTTMKTETAAWAALQTAVREPVAVFATPSSGGMYNIRVSLKQRVPGEARNAIAAVFGSMAEAKHVFAFDADIDVYSDEQSDWALATRFQGDRDLIVAPGFRVVPLDPSLAGARTGAKVGFDCTIPFGKAASLEWGVPTPPALPKRERAANIADVLAKAPASFAELMASLGSRDGREIVRALDALYAAERLGRRDDGRYVLKDSTGT
jgi:UbiD family decarboxylase